MIWLVRITHSMFGLGNRLTLSNKIIIIKKKLHSMSEIQPVNLLSAAPVGHNATLNLLKATHLAAVIEK